MYIKIYQINLNRDTKGVAFESYERHIKYAGTENIDSGIYDNVYSNFVDCTDLEEVYRKFNLDKPADFNGRSLSVSDIVEVVKSENIDIGFYYCDSIGYKKIQFNSGSTNENKNQQNRFEMIRAMELIARAVNDEEVFEYWLCNGVADGDIDENTTDSELAYYCKDERFADLMHTFLKLMTMAKKSGGLYYDGIIDKEETI